MTLQSHQINTHARPPLRTLALFFLKLGTIAFGGPAGHIGMMEDELVHRRGWISAEEFLDLLAVSNLLPGPSSTELAIFIGYRLRGIPGLLLSGICFIAPAMLMVIGLAWAYVRYGQLPAVSSVLYGVKAVVIAIVLQALLRLARSAIKSRWLAALGAAALLASLLDVNPISVLIGSGIVAVAWGQLRRGTRASSPLAGALVTLPLAAGGGGSISLLAIFLVFLKLGCIVFGSGYVLLTFLRSDLITTRHWLTESQLFDALAVGQVTPGPVFTTATFIGFLLFGLKGAIVATLGIFSPAFLFVGLSGPFVRIVRRSESARAFLDGLNVAALALMISVTYHLARTAIVDRATLLLSICSALALIRYQLSSLWLVATAAAAGLLVKAFTA